MESLKGLKDREITWLAGLAIGGVGGMGIGAHIIMILFRCGILAV